MAARLTLADAAGSAAGWLSRRLGRGDGESVHGRVALALEPEALRLAALGRRTILVSGTNGKSTTTALVVAALGGGVATNASGANMPFGLAQCLLGSRARWAVLEVDELYLPAVAAQTDAEAIVLLNLTRDTLDRMTEVSDVARRWRDFLATSRARCVANAADPHVVRAVGEREVVWVDPGPALWRDDSRLCPWCGQLLDWSAGLWRCECGVAQPEPSYRVHADTITCPSGAFEVSLALPGAMNVGNAAHALAAAQLWGVPAADALRRMSVVQTVAGRYATVTLGSRRARLILAKNPAGWAAALPLLEEGGAVIVGINAHDVDGFDTSWIWDVPFERFVGQPVGVTGENRHDLAVRLECAGALPLVGDDPAALADRLPPGPLTVIANYTAFRHIWRAYA